MKTLDEKKFYIKIRGPMVRALALRPRLESHHSRLILKRRIPACITAEWEMSVKRTTGRPKPS